VTKDVSTVDLSQYAAIIMAANYTSVRLRWSRDPWQAGDAFDARAFVQDPPVVRLFAEAMKTPSLVKGALCHGLWILTPHPELLRGRRVICHAVVMADVVNCGAEITLARDRVVVDEDLVTAFSKDETPRFVDAIAHQVVRLSHRKEPAMT
jgi:protease I